MELLHDEQIIDQINVYEHKIKIIKEKIRGELGIRRDLKTKLDEAMKREANQILILERLDEYEKIVSINLELVEKMEDSESIKQLTIINKYESMLQEQQEVWTKYKEEYEQLPLAKETQKAKLRLLKITIQTKLIYFKIDEIKRIIRFKKQIDKRRVQIQLIELAKLYVEHKKREKCCRELMEKVNKLRIEKRELQLEVNNLERQAKEMEKLDLDVKQTSIRAQQLPQVDLSRFIIHRNICFNNFDTFSVNSFILEQEYMNNDEHVKQLSNYTDKPVNSNVIPSTIPDTQNKVKENNKDTSLMEFDNSEEQLILSKQSSITIKLNSLGQVDEFDSRIKTTCNEKTLNIEELYIQSKPLNKPSKIHNIQEFNECDKKINYNPFINKTLIHESKSNSQQCGRNTDESRNRHVNRHQVVNDVASTSFFVKNENQRVECPNSSNLLEHPLPSPAKIAKRLLEEKVEQQQQQEQEIDYLESYQKQNQHQQHHQQQYYQNQKQQQQQQYQQYQHQPQQSQNHQQSQSYQQQSNLQQQPNRQQPQNHQQQQEQLLSPRQNSEVIGFIRDLTKLPQANKPQIKKCERVNYPNIQRQLQIIEKKTEPKVQETPIIPMEIMPNVSVTTPAQRINQDAFMNDVQPRANMPMSRENLMSIVPSNIMSTTMHSADQSLDNISAIIGSEITEPGGSFELVRRLYADSDLNSEEGEFEFEKMIGKFCSPIQTTQREIINFENNQSSTNSNNNTSQLNNQKQNERNFVFGPLSKKQTKTTQRFF